MGEACPSDFHQILLREVLGGREGEVGMFDNSQFDNSFGFVRLWKNRLFLGFFSVHKKSKFELIEPILEM